MKKRRRSGGVVKHKKSLKRGNGVSQLCLTELPTAVLHEILFRLPINSIVNVKFVCRAFNNLLSHPDFALNSSKNSPFAVLLVPNSFTFPSLTHQTLDLIEISDNSDCVRTTFKPKIPGWSGKNSGFHLAATCDGLLCLSRYILHTEVVYVCNPILGEYIALPQHKLKSEERLFAHYGFGFCVSTNYYKLLRIVPEKNQGEILTIGVDDRWRSLANPKIPWGSYSANLVALNGVFHWIFMDSDSGSKWISTFDLGEEKIGQLSHPHGLELNSFYMKLISISNKLCLVDSSRPPVIVVWKMEEYGVGGSWTKDVILDFSFKPGLQCNSLCPTTILKNGDILFSYVSGRYFLSYNQIKNKLSENHVGCYSGVAYAPSFLSVKDAIMGGHRSN